ncbi:MAG: Pathogenicity locus [Firmicutes bacterium]|nr:Pathogenicity locus [Bacillota bacterium]
MLVENDEQVFLNNLERIPGVGKKIATYMWDLGIKSIDDLNGKKPEHLYEQLCEYQGYRVDRCMLYIFRCAVYYASNDEYDVELLKWWNWKERG